MKTFKYEKMSIKEFTFEYEKMPIKEFTFKYDFFIFKGKILNGPPHKMLVLIAHAISGGTYHYGQSHQSLPFIYTK